MNNQEILNQLSLIEAELYYRQTGGNNREGIAFKDIQRVHDKVDDILNVWSRLTGLHIDFSNKEARHV